MSDFAKSFLFDNGARRGDGPKVALAAFGKHPGWDDHVEDIGLETESLIMAKAILYVAGIGGQIDRGAWEKLEPGQQMPGFNHFFLWRRGEQFLLGRIWSSVDGKGRSRYPMVLCAHCVALPLAWAILNVGAQLDEIQKKCAATDSAEEVKSIMASALADLRARVAAFSSGPPGAHPTEVDRRKFLESPALGPVREGLSRVIHQILSQMSSYSPFAGATKLSDFRPQQIRLPRGVDSVKEALLFWDQILKIILLPNSPRLLVASIDQPWLDVTVGEPETHELFSLRATDKKIPPASTVPYTLDEATKRRTEEIASAMLADDGTKPPFRTGESAPGGKGRLASLFAKVTGKWMPILVLLGYCLCPLLWES